jgi:hypothetical protein
MDAFVLSKFIKDSGISYKQTSNSFVLTCPRCSKKDKLYIRKNDGRFICFYCSDHERFSGKAEYALSEYLGIPVHIIQEQLYPENASRAALPPFLDISFDSAQPLSVELVDSPITNWPIGTYPLDHKYSQKGLEYLNMRGISLGLAKEYRLRYYPIQSRILFPVYSQKQLYGWQSRTVTNQMPKILSSKNLQKSQFVMFEDRLKYNAHVIICEGPIDAMKAHLCGGNIATMGKLISRQQITCILSYKPTKIYLALDPDAAKETNALLQTFGDYDCYLLSPKKGKKDLGEMSLEEVYQSFLVAPKVNRFHLCVYLK